MLGIIRDGFISETTFFPPPISQILDYLSSQSRCCRHIANLCLFAESPKDLWIVLEHGGLPISKHVFEVKGEFLGAERIYQVKHLELLEAMRRDHEVVKGFLSQLLTAFAFLESHFVVHADVKPDNILCDTTNGDYVLRLCDFGSAFFYDSGMVVSCGLGTPEYMPPEVLRKQLPRGTTMGGSGGSRADLGSGGDAGVGPVAGDAGAPGGYRNSVSGRVVGGTNTAKYRPSARGSAVLGGRVSGRSSLLNNITTRGFYGGSEEVGGTRGRVLSSGGGQGAGVDHDPISWDDVGGAEVPPVWAMDMWSLGAILLELCHGVPLWLSYKCRVVSFSGRA